MQVMVHVAVALALTLPAGAGAGAGANGSAAPTPPSATTPLGAFLRQADEWLLAGRMAPPELPRLLDALSPSDRLTALAYVRRSGVYDGPALDLAALLAPVPAAPE